MTMNYCSSCLGSIQFANIHYLYYNRDSIEIKNHITSVYKANKQEGRNSLAVFHNNIHITVYMQKCSRSRIFSSQGGAPKSQIYDNRAASSKICSTRARYSSNATTPPIMRMSSLFLVERGYFEVWSYYQQVASLVLHHNTTFSPWLHSHTTTRGSPPGGVWHYIIPLSCFLFKLVS